MSSEHSSRLRNIVADAIPSSVSSILVALSGGADSVALLRILLSLPRPLTIFAVHCNFHLRGDESRRDMDFVSSLCQALDVPLTILHFDTRTYAAEHRLSIEMACRNLRYDAFADLAETLGTDRIAVAHHLDDNIETMLLNLFRGTGLRGLAGMDADTGKIIRPLLSAPRSLILDYLHDIGQDFVTDSSNLSSDFRRNFIRNELIPMLASRWPGIRKSLARSQSNFRSQLRILDMAISRSIPPDAREIPFGHLAALPDPQTPILNLIAPFGGNGTHAAEIARAVKADAYPRRWNLHDAEIILDRDALRILTADRPESDSTLSELFSEQEIDLTPDTFAAIKADRSNRTLYSPLPLAALSMRHPRNGDRIQPIGMKGSRLLSDVLKDAGVPASRRQDIYILTDPEGRVLWIPGIIRSRHHLLAPSVHSRAYAITAKK